MIYISNYTGLKNNYNKKKLRISLTHISLKSLAGYLTLTGSIKFIPMLYSHTSKAQRNLPRYSCVTWEFLLLRVFPPFVITHRGVYNLRTHLPFLSCLLSLQLFLCLFFFFSLLLWRKMRKVILAVFLQYGIIVSLLYLSVNKGFT